MQAPPAVGLPQGVVARFAPTVDAVDQDQQRVVEEDLLGFGGSDTVFVVLTAVAVVPVEAGYLGEVDHGCILLPYTGKGKVLFCVGVNGGERWVAGGGNAPARAGRAGGEMVRNSSGLLVNSGTVPNALFNPSRFYLNRTDIFPDHNGRPSPFRIMFLTLYLK